MPKLKNYDFFDKKESKKYQDQVYKTMVENFGEEIFVADGEGKVLFVNPASVKSIGLPVYEIIGCSAQDLEDRGFFSKSCTMEVLKQRKTVNILQKMRDGRTLLATGVPIFDADMETIVMVICTSKDVKEVNRLLSTVESQEAKLKLKDAQIEHLQESIFLEEGFIYGDSLMKVVGDTVARIAPLEVTVLVEGETGVGKEVVVKTIHKMSSRKDKSFVKINCGIIPENLIEAELFGYEGGAFTGAQKDGKQGLVEIADGGTLFLDEIGEMPLNTQVKLLDFIQDGVFHRVGGTKKIKVDTRIIAATNRNLKEMCEKGDFRQDLYFRLNVIPLTIPPLRERRGDINVLTKYFMLNLNKKYSAHKKMDPKALAVLCQYHWPGNTRELMHVTERAFVLADGDTIQEETIKMILNQEQLAHSARKIVCNELMPLKEAKEEVERQLVEWAYGTYGSTYKAAAALSIDQSTVVKLLKKHKELGR